jgi:hypothetical protein
MPAGPEDQDDAGGHVFATVQADAFDHRQSATVANREALAGASGDVQLSAGGAVQNGIAGEHVALAGSVGAGGDRDGAAAQTFADVVVSLAAQAEANSLDQERPKTLSGGAAKLHSQGTRAHTGENGATENLSAEVSADAAIGIGDREKERRVIG